MKKDTYYSPYACLRKADELLKMQFKLAIPQLVSFNCILLSFHLKLFITSSVFYQQVLSAQQLLLVRRGDVARDVTIPYTNFRGMIQLQSNRLLQPLHVVHF